jgi:putative endonuclease
MSTPPRPPAPPSARRWQPPHAPGRRDPDGTRQSLLAAKLAARQLGKRGEELSARFLTARGYVVLARNWRCREGELDLVVTDRRRIVICEVKTRTSTAFGEPAEAVNPIKIQRIRRATHAWLRRHQVGCCDIRFDVLAVVWPPTGHPSVRHYENAF